MLKILENANQFGRVHHGFLNDLGKLDALKTHANKYPEYVEIAEGDICWIEDGKEIIIAMLHPYLFNRLPDRDAIKRGIKNNEIVTLEGLLEKQLDNLGLILELKSGIGDVYKVFERMLALLEDRAGGRYWIDTFSPRLLKIIKEISPGSPTSLHTRLGVYGERFIKTAFEIPPFNCYSLDRIPQADAVTVTYKNSPARYLKRFGASMDSIHKHVFRSGKKLIFGGIDSGEAFLLAKESKAIAAYLKFNKSFFGTSYGT